MISFKAFVEGDVVDLEKARRIKQFNKVGQTVHDALDQTYQNFKSYQAVNAQAVEELNAVEQDINRLYAKARVPGFEKFEDLMYFLLVVADINFFKPEEIPAEYRDKVRMVAHHADRLIDLITQAKTPVHNFLNKWQAVGKEMGVEVAPMEDATFLDHQLWSDIQSLKDLQKAHREGKL